MSKSAPVKPAGLTDQLTLDFTIAVLTKVFGFKAQGYRCQTRDVYRILVDAAARRSTIESSCNRLQQAPDSNTVRGYVNQYLRALPIADLERLCNRALAANWPHWLWSSELEVAVDVHDECYYGAFDAQASDNWVCNGQKREGTRHFYRCATLSIVRQRIRLSLAVIFVRPKMPMVDVLKNLLKYVRARGLRLRRLYADKGFCTVPVFKYLQRQRGLSAIIAVPRRGKRGGIRALFRGRKSYCTDYRFYSWRFGGIRLPLAIVRSYKTNHGCRKATWLVYALIRVNDSLRQVRQRYRARFGIDTSYRLMEKVRARTTSTLPALRFFWMGLALTLLNVWVALQWAYLRLKGSGLRRVDKYRFTLELMCDFLLHAVEAIYGAIAAVRPNQANL